MIDKFMSNADIILENLEESAKQEQIQEKNIKKMKVNGKITYPSKLSEIATGLCPSPNDMVDLLNKRDKRAKKMTHFKESVNNFLIESSLNTIFDMVLSESTSEDYERAIGHNIIKRGFLLLL